MSEETQVASSAPKQENDHIALVVVNQDSTEVHFKIRRNTPIQKLINSYCQRQGLRESDLKFLYDGERIHGNQTPQDLDMEDNDIIDAMLAQTGGSAC
mmetsp:Transcript_27288/g.76187  ORF Transcript_27288/g.76187 Transcript_27288/m.76187 type:complete len:98 (+) Transcript_27288:93-386(+)|eukprot:CAMPEP_0119131074 /NCGR_PEP_ID=MMETSP1310-20130426/9381_1 /TAXON_ID=464262 /ORGANISM="Genus nov. species nov., Strain RCC2339" /LENGTH=97 /DNA_ID=CAMNT_0007121627 /DNA_START=93 /DNA_END=386 /DNA_ORIENTATION=+